MTGEAHDTALETHIKEFLSALKPRDLILQRLAELEKPDPRNPEDLQRYLDGLKTVYAHGLGDMYDRIGLHGSAICKSTNETEITERVEKMMALAAIESGDIAKILKSFENAANETNLVTVTALLLTLVTAGARGLPRQGELDELTLELSAYCLTRFPPTDE
ncbi:MAG TPA: hypothetical protein VED43_16670 [Mycobacterium sp.]|nr:hypothetical protein [Mycobacterium sp.]